MIEVLTENPLGIAVAKNLFHDVVKNVLLKEGWTVTDSLRLKLGLLKWPSTSAGIDSAEPIGRVKRLQ